MQLRNLFFMYIPLRVDAKIPYSGNSNGCSEYLRSRPSLRHLTPIARTLVITTFVQIENYPYPWGPFTLKLSHVK